jgi:hypothetical protein
MFVSGLWHGMRPHFILWGILNGLLQGLERWLKSRRAVRAAPGSRFRQAAGMAGTIIVLILIGAPFKLEVPETIMFWLQMLDWSNAQTLSIHHIIKPVLGIGLSLLFDLSQMADRSELGVLRIPKPAQAILLAAGLLLLFLATRQQPATPFIYQEF